MSELCGADKEMKRKRGFVKDSKQKLGMERKATLLGGDACGRGRQLPIYVKLYAIVLFRFWMQCDSVNRGWILTSVIANH